LGFTFNWPLWYNRKTKTFLNKGLTMNFEIFKLELETHRLNLIRRLNGMKQRCNNKNAPAFKYWGAKGIRVCKEWTIDPDSFVTWALFNGFFPKSDIHRLNHHKDYSLDNCVFLDKITHAKFHAQLRREWML
jgi:hypothetical protein